MITITSAAPVCCCKGSTREFHTRFFSPPYCIVAQKNPDCTNEFHIQSTFCDAASPFPEAISRSSEIASSFSLLKRGCFILKGRPPSIRDLRKKIFTTSETVIPNCAYRASIACAVCVCTLESLSYELCSKCTVRVLWGIYTSYRFFIPFSHAQQSAFGISALSWAVFPCRRKYGAALVSASSFVHTRCR